MSKKKIYLIDGSSYFFRAYYAIQRLSNSKGFPTNAIYGFVNMLLKLIDDKSPEYISIVFDSKSKTFREDLYQDYKAHREAAPDDLVKQIPEILNSVDCFQIIRFEKEGYEADDIIATLTKAAKKDGHEVVIVSADKDLMQLVEEGVVVYDSMRDKIYDIAGVIEKFGVSPHQVVDFLALVGDASDNIPGVTGIGEKTAKELLLKFQSLDGIYANVSEIAQVKRRETLIAEKENAYLSQKLATLEMQVPLEYTWDLFSYQGPDKQKLKTFCEKFEFFQLLKRFEIQSVREKKDYICIDTEAKLFELCAALRSAPLLSIDTETTSLQIPEADLVGISLAIEPGRAFYLPVGHFVWEGNQKVFQGNQLSKVALFTHLKPILEDSRIFKVGQNLKYDYQILKKEGISLEGIVSDTLLASYLVDPESAHNLDSLSLRYLNHKTLTYEEVVGKGKSEISFGEVSVEKATEYSAEDADVALQLHHLLIPKLEGLDLKYLYEAVELPVARVLAEMEFRGIKVDVEKLERYQAELTVAIEAVEKEIHGLAGQTININSPKQLSVLLFEKLGLPVIRKTKTGFSTDEGVLEKLKAIHPIAEKILAYREFCKLKSTYVDGLLSQMAPRTGFIHTQFNQTVAATGRLSSSNPNLQNIPVGGNYDLRSVFIPRPGYQLLSADYSQIELRILAHFCGDENLKEAFEKNEDIHHKTASLIFGKTDISKADRNVAKTINFGVIYGQTPFGLSEQLGISQGEAKYFIEEYFKRYPKVKVYFEGVIAEAKKKGFVETILKRKRFLPDLRSSQRFPRELAERAAINMPIQGSAADLIKLAMVKLDKALVDERLESRMLLQVHDELVLEVKNGEAEAVKKLTKSIMEEALPLTVPIIVETSLGSSWNKD